MYKANLSHRQLEKYLRFLETKGMLTRRFEENTTVFQITEKGGEFLKDYDRISSYLADPSSNTSHADPSYQNGWMTPLQPHRREL